MLYSVSSNPMNMNYELWIMDYELNLGTRTQEQETRNKEQGTRIPESSDQLQCFSVSVFQCYMVKWLN